MKCVHNASFTALQAFLVSQFSCNICETSAWVECGLITAGQSHSYRIIVVGKDYWSHLVQLSTYHYCGHWNTVAASLTHIHKTSISLEKEVKNCWLQIVNLILDVLAGWANHHYNGQLFISWVYTSTFPWCSWRQKLPLCSLHQVGLSAVTLTGKDLLAQRACICQMNGWGNVLFCSLAWLLRWSYRLWKKQMMVLSVLLKNLSEVLMR